MAGHLFKLIDIGSTKYNGEARAVRPEQLLAEVCKHLMSRDVDITASGLVLTGGMRPAGRVEPVGDVAAAAFSAWCV